MGPRSRSALTSLRSSSAAVGRAPGWRLQPDPDRWRCCRYVCGLALMRRGLRGRRAADRTRSGWSGAPLRSAERWSRWLSNDAGLRALSVGDDVLVVVMSVDAPGVVLSARPHSNPRWARGSRAHLFWRGSGRLIKCLARHLSPRVALCPRQAEASPRVGPWVGVRRVLRALALEQWA